MKRILVTSALPYANGYIHFGHAAGSFLPADLYVRHMRLRGMPMLYVCGSDENGAAIAIEADKEGITPREIADTYHSANAEALERFGMSFDIYSRTSNPAHVDTAQEFFTDFLNKGLLVEQEEEQFFDNKFQRFLPDRYVEGTCPNCGFERARSDECDNCLAKYEPLELRNPISLLSRETPVLRKTKHWYFRFGEYQEFLENYIGSHKNEWKDNVIQQSYSWLNAGLSNRPVTRDLSWGVPVPLKEAEGKVIYVWFEALLGYITATKEWAQAQGKPDAWKEWWQDEETSYFAFLGKDNIWFHTLMFPAMLHARGNYILPAGVPANEFLNLEGQKFSKSRKWGIDLREYFQDFPHERDVDALRYALALSIPETKDADFTWKDFQARVNNELAAKLGNFINRSIKFLQSTFDGVVPAVPAAFNDAWAYINQVVRAGDTPEAEELLKQLDEKFEGHGIGRDELDVISAFALGGDLVAAKYDAFRFKDAVAETMRLAEAANKYFNDRQPWKTSKTDMDATGRTLYVCLQLVRGLAVAFAPVIPGASGRVFDCLGQKIDEANWDQIGLPGVLSGSAIETPDILFSKIEDAVIEAQVNKLMARSQAAQAAAATVEYEALPEQIDITTFEQTALRVGTVTAAEKIKKSNKLLCLQVDLGFEQRQIVSGIAQQYKPEELVGRKVIVVANLKPAKLRGVESQGMILCADTPGGGIVLISPDAGIPDGMVVR